MSNASFTVRQGTLTYWDLGSETEPDRLQAGLSGLGYEGLSMCQRTWSVSLKAALSCVDVPNTIVRKLKRDDEQRDGYSIVCEERGKHTNEYDTLVTAKVDDNGFVAMERGYDHVNEYELGRKTHHFRRVLPGASVSAVLVALVDRLGGLSIRPAGGLYFIPADRRGDWEAIVQVVTSSATDGSENHVSVVPFEFNSGTLRDVRRAIIAEVTAEAARIESELREGFKDESAVARRAMQALNLKRRTGEYESILGETLDACRTALDSAMHAFSAQSAVNEDADVFEGVF